MIRPTLLLALVACSMAADLPAGYVIPDRCLELFDGCNYCAVDPISHELNTCTDMACFQQGLPRCVRFAPRSDCGQLMCPAIYAPVCGSNGHTYASRCEFDKVECRSHPGVLRVLHDGECNASPDVRIPEGEEDCNKMCPAIWDPICASVSGAIETFGNKCELAVSACKAHTDSLFLHAGECTAADVDGPRIPEFDIPADCTVFNDGCNDCQVSDEGALEACTKLICDEANLVAPHCVSFVAGGN